MAQPPPALSANPGTFLLIDAGASPSGLISVTATAGAAVAFTATTQFTTGQDWFSIKPSTGTTPSVLNIAVDTSNLDVVNCPNQFPLAEGCYQGAITITPVNGGTPATVKIGVGVLPGVTGFSNAASFLRASDVAPGEIVTIFGRHLGTKDLLSSKLTPDGLLDTSLGSTRVLFDGVPSPLLYSSSSQISAIVPYSVGMPGKKSTQMEVEYKGVRSLLQAIPPKGVVASSPGIFTLPGSGQLAAINEDGTFNSQDSRAPKGSVLTFFATGEGQTSPAGIDGKPAAAPFPAPLLPVIVGINNIGAEILYVGGAPDLVAGVLQVNVRIPPDAPSGAAIPIVIKIGDSLSQPRATIAIR